MTGEVSDSNIYQINSFTWPTLYLGDGEVPVPGAVEQEGVEQVVGGAVPQRGEVGLGVLEGGGVLPLQLPRAVQEQQQHGRRLRLALRLLLGRARPREAEPGCAYVEVVS